MLPINSSQTTRLNSGILKPHNPERKENSRNGINRKILEQSL